MKNFHIKYHKKTEWCFTLKKNYMTKGNMCQMKTDQITSESHFSNVKMVQTLIHTRGSSKK